MRRPLRPFGVRAAAVIVALLAHALLWLVFTLRGHSPEPAAWTLQFVSIWPSDPPAPAEMTPVPARARRATPATPVKAIDMPPESAGSQESAVSRSAPPAIPVPPAPEKPQTTAPPVDWYGEAAKSAARATAKANEPPTFSPPPKVVHQACIPRKSSFEWNPEEKKAGLLPLPFVRLGNCVVGLGFFTCTGGSEANGHLFDDLKKGDRPVSSVPD